MWSAYYAREVASISRDAYGARSDQAAGILRAHWGFGVLVLSVEEVLQPHDERLAERPPCPISPGLTMWAESRDAIRVRIVVREELPLAWITLPRLAITGFNPRHRLTLPGNGTGPRSVRWLRIPRTNDHRIPRPV